MTDTWALGYLQAEYAAQYEFVFPVFSSPVSAGSPGRLVQPFLAARAC